MFSSFAWIIISFVICVALVAYISYVKTKGSDLESSNGYFLGGNSFAGIVICASLVMTDLSAEQLVGNNGQSVFVGMGVWAAQGTFWTGLVIAALIILPALLNAGVITLPQFFEKRFDKATRTIIAIVMILSYIICFLPAALYAGAQIFVNLIGLDKMLGISNFTAIVLVILMLLAIGLAYVLLGGMRAIAMSDTVFGFGMFGLGVIIPVACMIFLSNQLGGDGSFIDGLDKFINTRPEMMNAWNEWDSNAPWWPWPVIITGLVVNNVYFAGANQTIIQRALGGKSLAAAQKGMILAGLVDFFSPIFLVIPGIVAALAWPTMDFGNGDSVFGVISNAIIPTWFVGIYAAVLFGAILSTVNGLINSIQTMFAMDVYKQYINKDADDSRCVKIGRRFAVAVAVFSACFAPCLFIMSGVTTFIQSSLAILNSPILAILLFGIFSKTASAFAAKFMMITHIACYVLLNYLLPMVIPALGNVHFFYWTALLFIIDCLIVVIVSKYKPRPADAIENTERHYEVDMTPWKYRKHLSIAIIAITVIFYCIFSPFGLGKADTTTWEQNLQQTETSHVTEQQDTASVK